MNRLEADPVLAGGDPEEGIVAMTLLERPEGGDQVLVYTRGDGPARSRAEPLCAWVVAADTAADAVEEVVSRTALQGPGPLNTLLRFASWKACRRAVSALARATGCQPSDPRAPFVAPNDPLQQHLMLTGKTLFKGMRFDDLRRLQLDIECATTPGYSFCNAERDGDRILAVGLGDGTGWSEVLTGDEKEILQRVVETVRARDPDVIEGHNLFNFDLPYLAARARRHRVKLALGRDGSVPATRASRVSVGERTLTYTRADIAGRHVVDTLFLAHAFDVAHRTLPGYGLKEVARHFGVSAPDRTLVDPHRMREVFEQDPERACAYLRDDVSETAAVAALLAPSSFVQTQWLPCTYQNTCVRGSAAKVDALLQREYLRRGAALPQPEAGRPFAGGYTDVFETGVIRAVHHVDVRSLYPSLMITRRLGPRQDRLGVFLETLGRLREFRLEARRRREAATDARDRAAAEALQSAFKILINSFYGYLGFAQARFCDFDAAEQVTAEGRALLRDMVAWLRARGARPVEIDTDGIYFVPPHACVTDARALRGFHEQFEAALPPGIEVEFDGAYPAMYSYKMKNYALLEPDGAVVIKGAALKSRGLEPFLRDFLEDVLRQRLTGRARDLPRLYAEYAERLRERLLPVEKLAKSEMLQETPASYAAKVARGGRPRAAAYELALAAAREFRAGDQVSYYVTGDRKSVAVYEHARLVGDFDPAARDENVPYYLAKLEALARKFAPEAFERAAGQAELDLGV